ncbi:MAG TPA: pitrilysin family protein [Holophagaceae bacterium]|nr:pitrilysin family protein [Holophagaceae bacterium]
MLSRLALTLGVLASTVVPTAAQAIPDRPEKLTFKPMTFDVPKAKDARIKLKNGIIAYVLPDPTGQPLVTVSLLIKGGSYLEAPGKEGSVSLMGSLLRSGGTTKTPADQLDEKLEFLAANLMSNLGDTQGMLNLNLLSKDAKEGLGLMVEVLTQPAFAQDRLDLAKKNLRQAMERRNDDSTTIERQQLGYLLRGEAYYTNHQPTGASLDAITREDLQALHARLIHPENFILSVSGNFDRKAMEKLLNETFGALKPGAKAQKSAAIPAAPFAAKPGIYVVDKDVNQGRVSFSLPGLRRTDADYYAVTVMNDILGGGGFTSRLVKKIRSDEGLAYSAGSGFTPGLFFPGDFRAAFQSKSRSVAYGIRLAMAEMEKMRTAPVSSEELAVAKGSLVDGFPANFSNKAAVVGTFATYDYAGLNADQLLGEYRAKIQAVTAADVQRVAQKYLTLDKVAILVVGKASDVEEGDVKDHPGKLSEAAKLPLVKLPLRDPLTLKPLK